jgi:uncharacterized membrane protein
MNSALLVNIFRFILLLAFQIIIFNNMNFFGLHQSLSIFIIHHTVSCKWEKTGLVVASFLLEL